MLNFLLTQVERDDIHMERESSHRTKVKEFSEVIDQGPMPNLHQQFSRGMLHDYFFKCLDERTVVLQPYIHDYSRCVAHIHINYITVLRNNFPTVV